MKAAALAMTSIGGFSATLQRAVRLTITDQERVNSICATTGIGFEAAEELYDSLKRPAYAFALETAWPVSAALESAWEIWQYVAARAPGGAATAQAVVEGWFEELMSRRNFGWDGSEFPYAGPWVWEINKRGWAGYEAEPTLG